VLLRFVITHSRTILFTAFYMGLMTAHFKGLVYPVVIAALAA